MNFIYHSQGTGIYCKSFIPHNKQNHIQLNMSFRLVLLKLFLQVLHNTRCTKLQLKGKILIF